MSTTRRSVRGRAAVIGGFHAWPVLRAYFDELIPVPDSLEDYSDAEEYVEPEYGSTVLAPVQFALEGRADEFSALFVDRDHAMAFSYLQELHRRGALPGLPPLHVVDFVIDETPSSTEWTRAELTRLVEFCARTSGRDAGPARIQNELDAEQRLRAALAEVQERRESGRVRGVVAKAALAARRDAAPDEVVAALSRLADDPAPAHAPRVLLVPTGSARSVELHELVAAAGGEVVAEDDWHGARSIRPDAAPQRSHDLLDRVLDDVLASPATDRIAPMSRRLDWVEEAMRTRSIDALVVVTDPGDARHGWDAPHLRECARAQGVAAIRIHADLADPVDRERALESLRRDLAAASEGENR